MRCHEACQVANDLTIILDNEDEIRPVIAMHGRSLRHRQQLASLATITRQARLCKILLANLYSEPLRLILPNQNAASTLL